MGVFPAKFEQKQAKISSYKISKLDQVFWANVRYSHYD